MATKKTKKPAFPQRINVMRIEELRGGTAFLMASLDGVPDTAEDGDGFAVYELVETKTLRITKELK